MLLHLQWVFLLRVVLHTDTQCFSTCNGSSYWEWSSTLTPSYTWTQGVLFLYEIINTLDFYASLASGDNSNLIPFTQHHICICICVPGCQANKKNHHARMFITKYFMDPSSYAYFMPCDCDSDKIVEWEYLFWLWI